MIRTAAQVNKTSACRDTNAGVHGDLRHGFSITRSQVSRENLSCASHCHGSVREIMEDVWSLWFSLLEPLEPPPRGNVSISEALAAARGRGVVFGGVDGPFLLSPSATPFYDPLEPRIRDNLPLMIEAGTRG